MKRIRCRELHERAWCPSIFRDFLTDFLSCVWKSGVYTNALDMIAEQMKKTGKKQMVDLCSGRGEYVPAFLAKIRKKNECGDLHAVQTDLYPHRVAFEKPAEGVEYCRESLCAEDAIKKFDGVAVMFSALHHFDEEDLERIFRTAAECNRPIAFFDVSQRRFFRDILPNIGLPVLLFLFTPFIRPWSFRRFLYTYLIPVMPVLILADGTLSRLKAYKPSEIRAIAAEVEKAYPGYRFEVGRYPLLFHLQDVTYIVGSGRTESCSGNERNPE
ncbi:MAG: hypothetical protein BWY31_01706 [Lentisphaerae bacterium ADurb.Bin242]|nr:MAG: hypothetical protein BWY31_01706 [Lentisphaerae bacterium ADurb.Bin242]